MPGFDFQRASIIATRAALVGERVRSQRIAALSPRFTLHGFGDPIDQFADVAADRWIRDLRIGGEQFDRRGVGNELDRNVASSSLAERCIHSAFEKGSDWDAEHIGDLRKASGADAVRTLFVLLHLLERDAEPFCKVALRHARGQPMRANGFANSAVRRVRPSFLRFKGSGLSDRVCLLFHRRDCTTYGGSC
jgi:hypothetical protein